MKGRDLLSSMALAGLICALISTPIAAKQTLTINGQVRSTGPPKSVPGQLNYQGYLADAADSSTITATLEMTFRLFDSETKGAELWSETHTMIEVSDGLFQVLLGSMTSFPVSLFDGSPLWLQTEVGTDILVPRKPLVSVAYSQKSQEADHAIVAGDTDLLDGQSLTDLDGRWVNLEDLDHLDAADGDPADALSIDDDGKVGIGTTSPLTELDVTGSVNATTYYGDGSNLTGISGTTDNDWTISGDDIYHQMGNVGIGTNSPAAKLDIQGTLNVGQDTSGYDVNLYGSQSGSRLFWDEDKKALRVGWDYSGTSWIPDSIGSCSFAAGFNVIASGAYSVALGHTSTASAAYSTAIGNHTEASGSGSFSRGYKTTASGSQSIAMGAWLTASAPNTIVLGKGESDTSILTNNVANSLMVGFDTATPTLFVGGANHRVGIGNSSPSYKLDVNGTVNATTYYGDGSNLTGTTDNDWTIDGDDVYHETGKVGIGTTTPDRNLHIYDDVNNIVGIELENVNTEWSSREGITFADEHGAVAGIVTYDDDSTTPNSMRIYNNRTGGALTFWTGGLERMRLTNAGEVGIGTTSPGAKLHVEGTIEVDQKIQANDSGGLELATDEGTTRLFIRDNGHVGIGLTTPNRSLYIAENVDGLSYPLKIDNYNGNWNVAVGMLFSTGGDGAPSGNLNTSRGKGALVYEYTASWNRGKFHFLQNAATDSTNPDLSDAVLTIQNNGNVGIGTSTPGYKLDVNGDINVAGSYNIKKGGTNYTHPDYVFEPDYALMPLDELREHVFTEKSLPNVISAEDVKNNDGFKMDELLVQMLEKIEEQTLYIFQLEERIAVLEEKR